MELVSGERLDPGLKTEMLVPGNAFKEGVNKSDDDGGCDELGPEFGSLGTTA
jgi:hypothetical protein